MENPDQQSGGPGKSPWQEEHQAAFLREIPTRFWKPILPTLSLQTILDLFRYVTTFSGPKQAAYLEFLKPILSAAFPGAEPSTLEKAASRVQQLQAGLAEKVPPLKFLLLKQWYAAGRSSGNDT